MYSVSVISMVRPPTSWLLDRTASLTRASGMPNACSFRGSTTTWYSRSNPPTDATSATPDALVSWNRTSQSCTPRSSASVRCAPTTTY